MPIETYTVEYIADPAAFVAGARKVEASIRSVEAAAIASKKTTAGMFGNAGRSATAAAKNVDKLAAALGGIPPAANSARASLNGLSAGAAGATKSTSAFVAGTDGWISKANALAVAWRAAGAAIDMVGKAAEDAKKHLNEGAEAGIDKRAQAREYAGLLGKNAVDDEVMKGLFEKGQASGTTFKQTMEYEKQFLGSIPAARQAGHVTPDQEKILDQEGRTFGQRIGLDPGTAGDLAASIPQFVDLTKDEKGKPLTTRQGADKALGQFNALHYGLNEGKGQISTLAKNELGVAASALAAGRVADHAELGAFIGVGSTISKGGGTSGVSYKKLSRLLNETQGDEAGFLDEIGVSGEKGDYAKLGKLKEHVDAQRKAAPDPAKFDAGKYLASKGFGNDEEVSLTLGYMSSYDVLGKRRDEARRRAGDGGATVRANQEFLSSQDGQAAQARAIEEAGNYEQTRKRQRLAAARKAAYGQLQAEGKIDTFSANLTDGFLDGTVNRAKPNTAHEAKVDERVWENFRAASRRAGIEGEVRAKDSRYLEADNAQNARGLFWRGKYTGQEPTRLDDALNTFGPLLERKQVPINGAPVAVGTNGQDQANAAAAAAPGKAPGVAMGRPAGAPTLQQVAARWGQGGEGPATNTLEFRRGRDGGEAPRTLEFRRDRDGGGGVGTLEGKPGGGQVAAAAASQLDRAAEKLGKVGDALMAAARTLNNGRPTPGSDLGGSYGPYRA